MALIGDTIRLVCNFRTFDGKQIDPENIQLTIMDEQKNEIETIPIDDTHKQSLGVFSYDYVLAKNANFYEFSGQLNNKPILVRGELKGEFI